MEIKEEHLINGDPCCVLMITIKDDEYVMQANLPEIGDEGKAGWILAMAGKHILKGLCLITKGNKSLMEQAVGGMCQSFLDSCAKGENEST